MSADYEKKYFEELSESFPTRDAVLAEIIKLNAILNLPKGTEHFISDIHGEEEALSHILRNASGVIRRKAEALFKGELSAEEISRLCTLIYYPEEKLSDPEFGGEEYLKFLLPRLVAICRLVSKKYTRAKVRRRLLSAAKSYCELIVELIDRDGGDEKLQYYESIYKTVIGCGAARDFICELCSAIKALVVDRLHVVGDIFDRGARADLVIDELMKLPSIDIQWGNHDALWMGAASGSEACIAAVLNNSITYRNIDLIEVGYGISLRPLLRFSEAIYSDCDLSAYYPKGNSHGDMLKSDDDRLLAIMHKAISVIMFKLEGGLILRHPEFNMNDRRLLHNIDKEKVTVLIDEKEYRLKECFFPTVSDEDPYALTEGEAELMAYLKHAFTHSERLQRHISFLYRFGGMYKIYNRNLLFHGCIPLCEDGVLKKLSAAGNRCGRAMMDYFDKLARQGFYAPDGSPKKELGRDILWFLWCGRSSPLCARDRITTFERLLINDSSAWVEPRDPYYSCWDDSALCEKILKEFSLEGKSSHIINGHIPIKRGEAPIKGNGKLIVIDGGFCSAFYERTGIGGYTLIYNADGMRISAHEPFCGRSNAIKTNSDIISDTVIFESTERKIKVRECDDGTIIRERIADLLELLSEYSGGISSK